MKWTLTTSITKQGEKRISLNEDGKEVFHAIVSLPFDVNVYRYKWEVHGVKPRGFITEDTKAL